MNPERTTPEFWKERVNRARAEKKPYWWPVYEVSYSDWEEVQRQTETILGKFLRYGDSVLDVGCGIGAACECLRIPVWYTGFDVSSELVAMAKSRYGPPNRFFVNDVRELPWDVPEFMRYDLAFGRSTESTIGGNMPLSEWVSVRERLKRIARRVVWIEYDLNWIEENRPMKLTWRVDE